MVLADGFHEGTVEGRPEAGSGGVAVREGRKGAGFEAAVGRPVRYKNLVFTVKACERSAADEAFEDAIAHVTVESQPRAAPGKPTPPPRQAFRGWMYASSPGLNPLEHPIYDAWLITCRAAAPVPTATR